MMMWKPGYSEHQALFMVPLEESKKNKGYIEAGSYNLALTSSNVSVLPKHYNIKIKSTKFLGS